MFINEKVRFISSTLSSLTLSELKLLKEEIDIIIRTKNIEYLSGSDDIVKVVVIDSGVSTITSDQFESLKNKKTIPQITWKPESTLVNPSVYSCTIGEIKQFTPMQKSSRPLGIWKGQVEISEDFYETSSDIISEFGIEE
jgi:hypothetical protein